MSATSTLGAYATLLTGRTPLEHGVLAEWGEVPRHLDHLPQQLARHGYRTVMAFSEAELRQPGTGFPPMFDEVLPSLGRPAQSGDFTARAFHRWLDRRPDRPFFAWIQFFDAHPPCIPPEPFRSSYADPAYADALYNLAFSYVAEDRYAEALPLLQRYRALDEASSWAAKAEQALTLCRMALAAGRSP